VERCPRKGAGAKFVSKGRKKNSPKTKKEEKGATKKKLPNQGLTQGGRGFTNSQRHKNQIRKKKKNCKQMGEKRKRSHSG